MARIPKRYNGPTKLYQHRIPVLQLPMLRPIINRYIDSLLDGTEVVIPGNTTAAPADQMKQLTDFFMACLDQRWGGQFSAFADEQGAGDAVDAILAYLKGVKAHA